MHDQYPICDIGSQDGRKGRRMAEIVRTTRGESVELGPCPAWCAMGDRHFSEDELPDVADGFHHFGPEVMLPTAFRAILDRPKPAVRLQLQSFARGLAEESGPPRIEIELAVAGERVEQPVELTPDEARVLAASLVSLADIASKA
jgi:hypothetical protein